MKLIYCKYCGDVYPIATSNQKINKCRCGRTGGKYIDNIKAGIYGEGAVPIGLANEDLAEADKVQRNMGKAPLLRCWFIRPDVYDYKECSFHPAYEMPENKALFEPSPTTTTIR